MLSTTRLGYNASFSLNSVIIFILDLSMYLIHNFGVWHYNYDFVSDTTYSLEPFSLRNLDMITNGTASWQDAVGDTGIEDLHL